MDLSISLEWVEAELTSSEKDLQAFAWALNETELPSHLLPERITRADGAPSIPHLSVPGARERVLQL